MSGRRCSLAETHAFSFVDDVGEHLLECDARIIAGRAVVAQGTEFLFDLMVDVVGSMAVSRSSGLETIGYQLASWLIQRPQPSGILRRMRFGVPA